MKWWIISDRTTAHRHEWMTNESPWTYKIQENKTNIGEGETRHDKKHQEQERKSSFFPEIIVNILFFFFVPVFFFALKGKRIYPTLTSTLTMHRPTKHRPGQICSSTTTGGRASSEGRTERGRQTQTKRKTYTKQNDAWCNQCFKACAGGTCGRSI